MTQLKPRKLWWPVGENIQMVIPIFEVELSEVTTFLKMIQPDSSVFKLDLLLKDMLIHTFQV